HQTRPQLAVSAKGRLVFVPGKSGFAVWDAANGKKLTEGDEKRVFLTAGFSPDGKLLATADKAGKLDLWEAASGKRIGELPWTPKPAPKEQVRFGLKIGPGGAPELLPQSGLYYSVDPPSPEHDGGVLRIAFTGDGKRVIAGGATVVRAWDVESRKELWV